MEVVPNPIFSTLSHTLDITGYPGDSCFQVGRTKRITLLLSFCGVLPEQIIGLYGRNLYGTNDAFTILNDCRLQLLNMFSHSFFL
jgi:hypothetical protein